MKTTAFHLKIRRVTIGLFSCLCKYKMGPRGNTDFRRSFFVQGGVYFLVWGETDPVVFTS